MINDPCGYCAAAYGHKSACPSLVKNEADKVIAIQEWLRGKEDSLQGRNTATSDKSNGVYQLGRYHNELDARGLLPKQQRRVLRVPTKSEPRLIAVNPRNES